MLIRIPETPGIPAVLREIAALCPRHSSTAEQHGYSLASLLLLELQLANRTTDARARTRVHAIYISRTRDESEALHGWSRLLSYTHFPFSCVCLRLSRQCSICRCRCRLFEVERSTGRGWRYIGYPVRRPGRVSVKECRDDFRGKWKCRRFNKIKKEL